MAKKSFGALLEKIRSKKQTQSASRVNGGAPRDVLRINLGIDFGTSYTKVCFRDLSEEISGVVRLDGSGIIPSIVREDGSGRLLMEHHGAADSTAGTHRHLKMQLAGLTASEGANLEECKALSAWFLANVLREAQECLKREEADRFVGRDDQWSANVGVPVEWYDTAVLGVFEEVLRVAWRWNLTDRIPTTKLDAVSTYSNDAAHAEKFATDFHAIPEIAAAVQSFVISREASPGLYLYFDIGGGTVDGVAFNFKKEHGEPEIDFYSGKVEPHGMAYRRDTPEFWHGLQRQVSGVIRGAKIKENWREWRRPRGRREVKSVRPDHLIPDDELEPLPVFLGGYGSSDGQYCGQIAATYKSFNHANAGIPPYVLRTVPTPHDLLGNQECDFRRFAIAYGLSIQHGTGPEIRLPSELPDYDRPKPRSAADSDRYMDSKDLC